MSPRSWRCVYCRAELGIIEDGELQVSSFVRTVRCARDGTVWVGCFACSARRPWRPKAEKRRSAA